MYEGQHLKALLCYRALASGYGTVAARKIMALIHHGNVAEALCEVDRHHATSMSERQQLEETERALKTVRLHQEAQDDESTAPGSIGALARRLGIRTSTLRVWENEGLLEPARRGPHAHREYSRTDIRDARVTHLLRQSHYSLDSIRPIVKELGIVDSSLQLQAALEDRKKFIARRTMGMLRGDAALFDYISQYSHAGPSI